AGTEHRADLEAQTDEDVDPLDLAVGGKYVALLGAGGASDALHASAPERARREERFLDERAVAAGHLDAVVWAVTDVDESVVRRLGAVHGIAELLRRRCVGVVRSEVRVVGLVAVRAPVALDLARRHVNDSDALVAVAVGDVRLVVRRIE